MPLVWFRGMPCVHVSLDSANVKFPSTARFVVDTGDIAAHSGNLYGPAFRAVVYYGLASESGRSLRITMANRTDARTARLTSFRLGDFSHGGLVFSEASVNSLSLDYLSRYVVTFDFPTMRMLLRPGARYSEPDYRNVTGLRWLRTEGNTVVTRVDEGSYAAAAGFRKGDIIVELEGVAASTLSTVELRRTILSPSTRSITVRRAGAIIRVRLPEVRDGDEPLPLPPAPGNEEGQLRGS